MDRGEDGGMDVAWDVYVGQRQEGYMDLGYNGFPFSKVG